MRLGPASATRGAAVIACRRCSDGSKPSSMAAIWKSEAQQSRGHLPPRSTGVRWSEVWPSSVLRIPCFVHRTVPVPSFEILLRGLLEPPHADRHVPAPASTARRLPHRLQRAGAKIKTCAPAPKGLINCARGWSESLERNKCARLAMRVSTSTQNLDRQLGALRAERCHEVYREKASGKAVKGRPQLEK